MFGSGSSVIMVIVAAEVRLGRGQVTGRGGVGRGEAGRGEAGQSGSGLGTFDGNHAMG